MSRANEIWHLYDYVLGVYDFMERLVTRYPDILLEGCSGGGGRFDAGMLYYSPQIWCSDNRLGNPFAEGNAHGHFVSEWERSTSKCRYAGNPMEI